MLNNKSILITGGTGTLGQALVKHILANYKPRRLVVFSRDELKQTEMAQQFSDECMRFFIGDIRDLNRLRRAFNDVDMVIHAAALKHVNQAEYDCDEYIKTNVYGTQNVIDAAIDCEVEKVLLISTDKAVNPISLYGASKLTSEKLFVAANNMVGRRKTRFSVVRLGNIWGSRGSVIPYYKKLVAQGAEFLPVTDESMTRFFITSENASLFTLDCFTLMQGGETFIPKMPSIHLMDIVTAFGKKSKIVGIRPGEKLHETMCPVELADLVLDFGDYYVIEPTMKLVHNYDYAVYESDGYAVQAGIVGSDFKYDSQDNGVLTFDEVQQLIREA
jgi:UDP-N-acetylglucosamine 4,6-dehydratase